MAECYKTFDCDGVNHSDACPAGKDVAETPEWEEQLRAIAEMKRAGLFAYQAKAAVAELDRLREENVSLRAAKRLEWRETTPAGCFEATTDVADYRIYPEHDHTGKGRYGGWVEIKGVRETIVFYSLIAKGAQEACQQHFDQTFDSMKGT